MLTTYNNRYIDYHGYYSYYDAYDPIYYPLSFNFAPGGYYELDFGWIALGQLFAIASAGAVHGPPHHLKLVSDTYQPTDCGSVRRWLKFKVVDDRGRNAGHVKVEESFESVDEYPVGYEGVPNSCWNFYFYPGACRITDWDQTFTDQLWVGCPSAGGECGYPTVASVWWW